MGHVNHHQASRLGHRFQNSLFVQGNQGARVQDFSGNPFRRQSFRSGKGSAYEGGTRVPTVVRWPGAVAEGTVCTIPVISHDLFPTILDIAGVPIPAEHAPTVDGRSLVPLLRDRAGFDESRALCWTQPHQWGASGPGIEPFTSIRVGNWKLLYFHPDRRLELYDLAADIGETRDLAIEHPEKVRELAGRLDAWIREAGVQLSIDKRTGRMIALPGDLGR